MNDREIKEKTKLLIDLEFKAAHYYGMMKSDPDSNKRNAGAFFSSFYNKKVDKIMNSLDHSDPRVHYYYWKGDIS